MFIVFEMKKFGKILTDRADGKKAFDEILLKENIPNILDFTDVISLGSSFGDEVLPQLAKQNNNKIIIKNATQAVVSCIKKIIEDTGIEVEYLS